MVLKITGGTGEGIKGMLTTGQGMKDKKNSTKIFLQEGLSNPLVQLPELLGDNE